MELPFLLLTKRKILIYHYYYYIVFRVGLMQLPFVYYLMLMAFVFSYNFDDTSYFMIDD